MTTRHDSDSSFRRLFDSVGAHRSFHWPVAPQALAATDAAAAAAAAHLSLQVESPAAAASPQWGLGLRPRWAAGACGPFALARALPAAALPVPRPWPAHC